MTPGTKVKVKRCRKGWTDRFKGRKGEVMGKAATMPDAMLVLLDDELLMRVFFEDELTIIEEAPEHG